MARLPRLRSAGVQANIPRSVDFAGLRGEAAVGQTISQTFDQMSDFLFKTAQKEAVRSGIERVRTEGAQPILEAMKAQGGPRGLEEETAYDAANKIAIAEIQSEAELEITKILTEGQNNKTSFSTIQSQLQSVSDGFPAALSDIDPVSAAILRTRLQETSGKAELRYSKYWSSEILKDAKIKQDKAAANGASWIIGNASQIDGYTTAEIDADIASEAKVLLDLGAKPENVDAWGAKVKEKAYQNRILFSFYQKPLNEQKEQIDNILSGKETIAEMDYEDSVRFVNSLLRPEYNRNVTNIKAQSAFVVNTADDYDQILENGGNISLEDIEALRSKAGEISEFDGGVSLNRISDLEDSLDFFNQLRSLSRGELEAQVIRYTTEGIPGEGAPGVNTSEEIKRRDQAQKFFENMITSIEKNPMDYAQRTNFVQPQPIVSFNEETGEIVVDDQALSQRMLDSQKISSFYSLPIPKPLLSVEVRALTDGFEMADTRGKMQILGVISKFNQAAGQVLTQVSEFDTDMAMLGHLVNEGSTEAVMLALGGKERMKAGVGPVGATDSNILPVYYKTVGSAITQPSMQGAVLNVAKMIYTEQMARQGFDIKAGTTTTGDLFNEDVFIQSLQLAMGQTQSGGEIFGGVQRINDFPVYIPNNKKASSVGNFLKNKRMLLDLGIDEKMADAITNPRTAENYSAQHIGQDKYKIIYHNRGGFALKQIENTDGIPVIFRVNEMASQVQSIAAPEAMSEVVEDINVSDLQTEQADQTPFSTTQDPAVETKRSLSKGEAERSISAEFGSGLRANKKQTEKLVKELEAGIQSGKLNEASTVRFLESLPEPGDANFDADLYTAYADFIIDGGSLTYTQWLKTKQ